MIREGSNYFGRAFVTVTGVRVTPDMGIARIYLSALNAEQPKQLIEEMNGIAPEFRHKLSRELRHDLRKMPELEFFYDETMDEMEKVDKLLDKYKAPDEGEQDESTEA